MRFRGTVAGIQAVVRFVFPLLVALSVGCAGARGGGDRGEAPGSSDRREDVPAEAAGGTDEAIAAPAGDPDAAVREAEPAGDAGPGSIAEAAAAPPEPVRRRVVVQATGDYILHTRVHNSARFHAEWPDDPDGAATEGYSYLVYRVKPVLARGDLNLVNLETPLATERNEQSGNPPMLNGPPIAAASLVGVGFHAASIANNHAYDQEEEGVAETRAAAEAAGLQIVGGGANSDVARSPVFVERNGVRIGILAFTESVNRTTVRNRTGPDDPQVAIWRGDEDMETIRSIRRQCDLMIVMFHWGGEFDLVPNRFQRRTAADLCGEGVDVILGTHSHTLQEVRRLEGPDEASCIVAYSLGNFVSNQGLKYRVGWTNPDPDRAQGIPYTRDGVILRMAWEEDPEGRLQLATLEAVPLWGENNWLQRFGVRNFENDVYTAPLYASMADPGRSERYADLYAERLDAIREALGDDVTIVPE